MSESPIHDDLAAERFRARLDDDVLRRAAAELRTDSQMFDNLDANFCRAVADWLDACADSCPPPEFKQPTLALTVARAYLGDPA